MNAPAIGASTQNGDPWTAIRDALLAQAFEDFRSALLRGETVILPGLGSLKVLRAKPHAIVNPITGLSAWVTGETRLSYQPCRALHRAISTDANGANTR